jgi:hypothetical protein
VKRSEKGRILTIGQHEEEMKTIVRKNQDQKYEKNKRGENSLREEQK